MKNFLLLLLFLLTKSCTNAKKTAYSEPVKQSELTAKLVDNQDDGEALMENQCYICHNPALDHKARIAPPMAVIKARYSMDYDNKKEFANAIWTFVAKLKKESTKLKGAVKRIVVMPFQEFSESDIRSISEFIFENEIEAPEWIKNHQNDDDSAY